MHQETRRYTTPETFIIMYVTKAKNIYTYHSIYFYFLQKHFNLTGNHKAQSTRNTTPLSASQFVQRLPHVTYRLMSVFLRWMKILKILKPIHTVSPMIQITVIQAFLNDESKIHAFGHRRKNYETTKNQQMA